LIPERRTLLIDVTRRNIEVCSDGDVDSLAA
jgi:hypothetical protein